MRAAAFALLLTVTGCGDYPTLVFERQQVLVVPVDMQDCPVPPVGVPAPRPPRTLESVLSWVRLVEDLRKESQNTAILCRQRLHILNELVKSR